jgi:hypothetical protein
MVCQSITNLQNGLDIEALRAHVAAGNYLAEFPEGTGERRIQDRVGIG